MTSTDTWDPQQYERFKAQRDQPALDLIALLAPVPGGAAVDLGCGTGELTGALHRHLGVASTIGIDTSSAMLDKAAAHAGDGVRFEQGDIETWTGAGLDVVFANASLQWVPGHHGLYSRLAASLAPGGQLAVQVPANYDHPSHVLAAEVGARHGAPPSDRSGAVLAPEAYAELLESLGFTDQLVRLQVYGNRMAHTADVLEWIKGTLLTEYRRQLGEDRYPAFVEELRTELLDALGDPSGERPYFYAFKRILLWARK